MAGNWSILQANAGKKRLRGGIQRLRKVVADFYMLARSWVLHRRCRWMNMAAAFICWFFVCLVRFSSNSSGWKAESLLSLSARC
uniref:Uncharacterized protein n=1 Tax=Arundo donax TaxID=35708 RepID=A0A0A9DRX2_ARUDO